MNGVRKLYVDNVLVASELNVFGSLPLAENDYLVIGAKYQDGYASWSHVMLYDARIYGYALSPAEITGVNKLPPSTPPTPLMTATSPVNGQITINWDAGILQSTTALKGTSTVWVTEGATGPITINSAQTGNKFYRVVAQ